MKKSNHKIAATIDVTPNEAWQIIGAVDGVDKWLAPIQTCRVEGDKRFCSTEEGEFSEDILKVDHDSRVLEYHIPSQNMLPVENIQGRMQVTESAGKATVEWAWDFDVDEGNEASAKEMLSMVGNMGISGIESLIKRGDDLAA